MHEFLRLCKGVIPSMATLLHSTAFLIALSVITHFYETAHGNGPTENQSQDASSDCNFLGKWRVGLTKVLEHSMSFSATPCW